MVDCVCISFFLCFYLMMTKYDPLPHLDVIPQDKDITLENKIIFQRNRVVGNGGGLFISNENVNSFLSFLWSESDILSFFYFIQHDQGNIRIIGASFIENNCSNAGGGIFMSGLSVTLKDSTLENDPRKAVLIFSLFSPLLLFFKPLPSILS